MPTIAIRVSDEDHKLFVALAEREFMPLSVLVRRTLRAETVRAGLILDPAEQARRALEAQAKAALAPQKPIVERRPYPPYNASVVVAERASRGESLADIAESYGISLDRAKELYKSGKEWLSNERDTNELLAYSEKGNTAPPPEQPEPELVYDPVDPDNPTEEEQAVSDEIARRKLVAFADHMGLNL
jgi:hypothetical protein